LHPRYLALAPDVQARIISLLEEREEIMRQVRGKKRRTANRYIIEKARVYATNSPVKSRARIVAERTKMKEISIRCRERLTEIDREIRRLRQSNSLRQAGEPDTT